MSADPDARAVAAFAARLAATERRLHGLETAPRAPFTTQVINQQAEILATQARLAETTSVLTITPGSNIDAVNSGAFTDWLSMGSVTVPSWAWGAFAVVSLTDLSFINTGGITNTIACRVRIGSNPFSSAFTDQANYGLIPITWGWGSVFTTGFHATPGTQEVNIQAAADGARARLGSAGVAGVSITFLAGDEDGLT